MLPHGSSVEVQPAKVHFELCGYFWGGVAQEALVKKIWTKPGPEQLQV